jgi:hypothetical protein
MTVGVSTVNTANAWLNVLRNTSFTGVATPFLQLHTGDPGASGTANVSAVTTRQAITWSAASSGAIALSNTPSFTMTTTETITHVSVWSASSAGTFYYSAALTVSRAVVNTDTLNFNTLGVSITPLAA